MKPGEIVVVAHALPRRVRLAAPPLTGQRAACERAARALAQDPRIRRVTVHPATGSVIVEADLDERPLPAPELAAALRALVLAERDERGRSLPELGPEDQPGPTRVARAVVHAVAGINADVRAALDQRADLGTILPVVFAALGVAEVAASGKMPVPTWFNLLWWSLRSFMTFNIRAVEEEVGDDETERHAIAEAL
jgi:Heavy metal associated domain 2